MKKILALMLALAMTLALVACGSSGSSSSNGAASSGASVSSSADASADASGDASADASTDESAPVYDEMTIMLACSNGENETAGQIVAYFCNYIEEKSNGAINMDPYYGGTLCSNSEVLSFVSDGSVDMCLTGTSDFVANIPLINFPGFVYGSQQEALDFASYICFDNEETASLIAAELAENNVVTVGMHAGGANGYFFKSEYASLKDAASSGLILGCGMHLACYEKMGFGTSVSMPWDTYSELETGKIGCTTMAVGPAVGMGWTEVAPYILINNQYSFGNFWLINQDVWNSMSADTQALFYEAGEASMAYSLELYASELTDAEAAAAAAGGSLLYMSEEETAWERDIFFSESYADCMANAASAGKTAEMTTILEAVNEYLGLDLAIEG